MAGFDSIQWTSFFCRAMVYSISSNAKFYSLKAVDATFDYTIAREKASSLGGIEASQARGVMVTDLMPIRMRDGWV